MFKKFLSLCLALSVLSAGVVNVYAFDNETGKTVVALQREEIDIEQEINLRVSEKMQGIKEQLEQQDALDLIDTFEDIIYSQVRYTVYKDHGMQMPASEAVPYGDEDEVREPPLYTMEYGGIVKYHKDGEIITVICMDRMKTLKMLVEYKINGWTDTAWQTTLGELFDIIELPWEFTSFVGIISTSVAVFNRTVYNEMNDADGYSMSITVQEDADDDGTTTLTGWDNHPDYQTPEGSTRWSCQFFDE